MAGRLKVDDVTGKVTVDKAPTVPTVPTMSSLSRAAQHLKTGKYAPVTASQSVMPAPFDED